jgi:hypothetical protein
MVAGPASAAMTIVYRGEDGGSFTYQQEGSRVRISNPTQDPGAVSLIDVETGRHVIVYDEVKAYFDVRKAMSQLRDAMGPAGRAKLAAEERRAANRRYRATGEVRTVNGFSCAMHERVVARQVDAQICYAKWGDGVGQSEDFAWLDAFWARMGSELLGKSRRSPASLADDKALGLAVWTSSVEPDGTRSLTEVVKISRDPLPAALFDVPATYQEVKKPISASERVPNPAAAVTSGESASPASPIRIPGWMMLALVVVALVGWVFQAAILHMAAYLVLARARFTYALIAGAILWATMFVAYLLHLPRVLDFAVGGLANFASLKIAYGAPTGKTVLLFVVSCVLAVGVGFGLALFFP